MCWPCRPHFQTSSTVDLCAVTPGCRRARLVGTVWCRPAVGWSGPVTARPARPRLVVQLIQAAQFVAQLTHSQTARDAASTTRWFSDERLRLERPDRLCDDVVDSLDIYLSSSKLSMPTVDCSMISADVRPISCWRKACVNPLKRSGVRWLHFEVFSAIQV